MDFYSRVFFYCFIILYGVFCQFGVTDVRAATNISTPRTIATKKNETSPVGKVSLRKTEPKIVNLRSTSDDKCQCVYFFSCAAENIDYEHGGNCDNAGNFVCCKSPNTVTNGTPTDENTNTTDTPLDCKCVQADQCERSLDDQVSGADAIDIKKYYCGTSGLCCPFDKIINSSDGNPSPTRPTDPSSEPTPTTEGVVGNISPTSVSTTISTGECKCVLPNECRKKNEEDEVGGAYDIDEKNPRRCNSISQTCCPLENIIKNEGNPPSTGSTDDSTLDCGMRNTAGQDFFNNSKDTTFGEFPWMAQLVYTQVDPTTGQSSDVVIGGASLISSKVILTAAHRLRNVTDVNLLKVRLGEYDTTLDGDKEHKPHQDRQVLKITRHPKFKPRPHYNNLALLEVTEPFTLDYHIKPICIPSTSKTYDYDPTKCVATGWGKTTDEPNSPLATTLKKIDLTIVPSDTCQEELRKTRLGQKFELHSSLICARSPPGMDTCECDGGGPLVCPLRNDPNRYVQVGIVSWGIGCSNGLPGVYASLERNVDWLTQEANAAGVFSSSSMVRKKS